MGCPSVIAEACWDTLVKDLKEPTICTHMNQSAVVVAEVGRSNRKAGEKRPRARQ